MLVTETVSRQTPLVSSAGNTDTTCFYDAYNFIVRDLVNIDAAATLNAAKLDSMRLTDINAYPRNIELNLELKARIWIPPPDVPESCYVQMRYVPAALLRGAKRGERDEGENNPVGRQRENTQLPFSPT